MPSMAYAMFRNTRAELTQVLDNIDKPDLSPDEEKARRHVVELCAEICAYFHPDIDVREVMLEYDEEVER